MINIQNTMATIETLPAMRVACLRTVSASPEEEGRARLDHWIASQGLVTKGRKFGFDVEIGADEKAGMRGYEVWETVPEHVPASDNIRIQDFPGGLYATMILDRCFEEPFVSIPNGWKILHTWVIQNQEYQSAGHQWLEEVLQMDYGETLKLYYPVMPCA